MDALKFLMTKSEEMKTRAELLHTCAGIERERVYINYYVYIFNFTVNPEETV